MFGKGNGGTSNAVYFVRILVGAHLLYIDYQIFDDAMAREGMGKIVMIGFMILFAITGLVLIMISLRALLGLSSGTEKKEDKENGSKPGDTDDVKQIEESEDDKGEM